jgi:hypothetical protein
MALQKGNGPGPRAIQQTGSITSVWANPTGQTSKPGGITFDWSTVTPLNADLTLPDGTVIPSGTQCILYGMFMAQITRQEVQTITITGGPAGGYFTLTVVRGGQTLTTAHIAYDATAQDVADALNALDNVDGVVTVTGSNPGPFSVTFVGVAENVAQMTASGAGLTGGTTPGVTIGTTTSGEDSLGYYGLYDASASDGRQNRLRGQLFFIDKTLILADKNSAHPSAFDGGTVFKERMKLDDSGGTPAPGYMTTAQMEAAFPGIRYAR